MTALMAEGDRTNDVESDRKEEAIRRPGEEEDEDGDLEAGMMFLRDTEDDRNDEDGRELVGGEGSFSARYSDPFSDANRPPSPPTSFLPRSPPLHSLPVVLTPITSRPTLPALNLQHLFPARPE
jgi:hypothetical protein